MGSKDSPCYMCERRKPLCHSTCEDYITYTQEKANGAELIRAKKAEEAIYKDVLMNTIKKITKTQKR